MHSHRWNSAWTVERVDTLKRLWLEGYSARQIADHLSGGITRNAVIGKCHRLKLTRPGHYPTQPQPPRSPRTYAKRAPPLAAAKVAASVKIGPVATLIASGALAPPTSKVFIIDALTARTCKWMDGDPKQGGTFCGHETLPGAPYCGYHYGRAHYKGSQADFDSIAEKVLGKEPKGDRLLVEAA